MYNVGVKAAREMSTRSRWILAHLILEMSTMVDSTASSCTPAVKAARKCLLGGVDRLWSDMLLKLQVGCLLG